MSLEADSSTGIDHAGFREQGIRDTTDSILSLEKWQALSDVYARYEGNGLRTITISKNPRSTNETGLDSITQTDQIPKQITQRPYYLLRVGGLHQIDQARIKENELRDTATF